MQQRSNKNRVMIMESNPQSPICEAYRTLRVNIDFSTVGLEKKTLMVTSAQAAEGKTTTASNLAIAYSQSEKRVLLVDADMRNATLHQFFNQDNRIGLSNLLAGQYNAQELVVETHIPRLDLLTSGPLPPNPSELLSSERWAQFVDYARTNYDVVIFDTPPALTLPDAQLVAGQCGGVLIVVKAGKVKREVVKKLKTNLEYAQARILGVVLNHMNRKEAALHAYR
ncbi:CpsD/CapB family tyrosine-protein kinase [Paenibacillus elgii]